jgi:hypothetical protein
MNRLTGIAIAVAVVLVPAARAAAQAQVAVVGDVSSKTAGVEFMDYVAVGRQIRLEPRDTIVLEYLQSCWRETITGGQVTIGTEQSDVRAGQVERHKVNLRWWPIDAYVGACEPERRSGGARDAFARAGCAAHSANHTLRTVAGD